MDYYEEIKNKIINKITFCIKVQNDKIGKIQMLFLITNIN